MEGRARHLLDYWAVFRRRRWVLLFAVSTATTLALVGSILSTRLYRATATLQIERLNPDILSIKDLARVDYNWAAYADYYQTQYKILASEAVARGAVEALNLTAHPLFAPQQPAGSLLQKVRSLLPGGAVRSRPADPALAAARAVLARLQVTPIRGSQLVQVSWVASDPELAAQVANALAEAYIEFNMGLQYESSGDASGFLEQQIADLKRGLNQLETTLQDYGESKNIVSIDDANNVTMRALADIAQRRTECQTALARAEATYKAVLASPEEVLAEAQNPGLINRLREDYARYEAEYSEKSRLFKADWPELQTLTSKMEQAKQRLEEGIRTTASHATLSAESEYRKAARELANLTGLVRDQERSSGRGAPCRQAKQRLQVCRGIVQHHRHLADQRLEGGIRAHDQPRPRRRPACRSGSIQTTAPAHSASGRPGPGPHVRQWSPAARTAATPRRPRRTPSRPRRGTSARAPRCRAACARSGVARSGRPTVRAVRAGPRCAWPGLPAAAASPDRCRSVRRAFAR